MQRAIGRAYRRLQGAHPRRPKSRYSFLIEVGCDLLLTAVALATLGAFALLAWAMYAGLEAGTILMSLGLVALAALLLLLWERIAWEPFAERLSELT